MTRPDDDEALDPRLLPFVEVLAEALVREYRNQVASEQKQEPQEEAPK
jgi:hypothetical protein